MTYPAGVFGSRGSNAGVPKSRPKRDVEGVAMAVSPLVYVYVFFFFFLAFVSFWIASMHGFGLPLCTKIDLIEVWRATKNYGN
jgi:hypothetical protein